MYLLEKEISGGTEVVARVETFQQLTEALESAIRADPHHEYYATKVVRVVRVSLKHGELRSFLDAEDRARNVVRKGRL